MAKPKTYPNKPAKWWSDCNDYPPEWKAPVDGQMEMFDELDTVAADRSDAQVPGGGSAATP